MCKHLINSQKLSDPRVIQGVADVSVREEKVYLINSIEYTSARCKGRYIAQYFRSVIKRYQPEFTWF